MSNTNTAAKVGARTQGQDRFNAADGKTVAVRPGFFYSAMDGEKISGSGKASTQLTRYGVEWSSDGQKWLHIVNSKTLEEAREQFRLNTATHKRIVRHDITRTEIS